MGQDHFGRKGVKRAFFYYSMLVRVCGFFFFFLVECYKTIDQLLRFKRKRQKGQYNVRRKEQRGVAEGEKWMVHTALSPSLSFLPVGPRTCQASTGAAV